MASQMGEFIAQLDKVMDEMFRYLTVGVKDAKIKNILWELYSPLKKIYMYKCISEPENTYKYLVLLIKDFLAKVREAFSSDEVEYVIKTVAEELILMFESMSE